MYSLNLDDLQLLPKTFGILLSDPETELALSAESIYYRCVIRPTMVFSEIMEKDLSQKNGRTSWRNSRRKTKISQKK